VTTVDQKTSRPNASENSFCSAPVALPTIQALALPSEDPTKTRSSLTV
jgi:hypothetical protein